MLAFFSKIKCNMFRIVHHFPNLLLATEQNELSSDSGYTSLIFIREIMEINLKLH